MPTASTSRSVTTKTRPNVRTKPGAPSVDRLADQLASTLSLKATGKKKATVNPEEQKVSAMRSVNAASQTLSTVAQSGWKNSTRKSTTLTEATAAASAASKNLDTLRRLTPEDIDVERAAASVLAKLVALEMYDVGLSALPAMRERLCTLAGCDSSGIDVVDQFQLLFIPLPVTLPNSTLLTLISTYLTNAIIILTYSLFPSYIKPFPDLGGQPGLLQWLPHLSSLPQKHTDSVITRVYSALTKSTATWPLSTHINATNVFTLRCYAMSCLAHSGNDTLKNPDNFWDQASKFAASYVKSLATSDAALQNSMARLISTSFMQLVSAADTRPDKTDFMQGKGFVAFCDYWMRFANKVSDVAVLDHIVMVLHASSPTPTPTVSSELSSQKETNVSNEIDEKVVLECMRLCATLTQAISSLETEPEKHRRETTIALKSPLIISTLSVPKDNRSESMDRIAGKLERALDRMRKSLLRLLEKDSQQSSPRELLLLIVDLSERVLELNRSSPLLSPALDTLFSLSRSELVINDPRTYIGAHDLLTRAMSILQIKDSSSPYDDIVPAHGNYIRCLSGAFHNAAGTLYQAGRYGSAIGFLKEGCQLGSIAIKSRSRNAALVKNEEGWKQLEEQLYRRWQLLGVCYFKVGDRQLAFTALLQCVKSFPYSESGAVRAFASKSLSAAFTSSSALKEITTIIERLSYLGACDLLLATDRVSLRSLGLDPEITGALLEYQLSVLDSSRAKASVQQIIVGIMLDALDLYSVHDMPVRRSRVILRALDFGYHLGPGIIEAIGSPDSLAGNIENLLTAQTLGKDAALAPFCSQLRAAAHLLLTMHVHRRVDKYQYRLAGNHATEACKILQSSLFDSQALPAKPQIKAQAKPKREPVRRPKAPVTPKRKPAQGLEEVSLQPAPLSGHITATIDELDRLNRLLTLTSHILNLLSLSVPRLLVLELIRKLAEKYGDPSADDYIIASTNLGCEYLRLGKIKRASKIFGQTLTAVQSTNASVHAQSMFYLRYAESLALVEDVLQSSALYCQALTISQGFVEQKAGSTVERIQARVSRIERAATAAYVFSRIQYFRDDASASLDGLLHSLRLWNRAFEAISRLQPAPSSQPREEANPFEDSDLKEALPPSEKKSYTQRPSMDSLEWRISQGLLGTMFALIQAYFARGSVREAEYFVQQAEELAEALNAPAMVARAVAKKGELQIHQGLLVEGNGTVAKALGLLQGLPGVDAADIHRLRADYSQRTAQLDDAKDNYELSKSMLDEIDKSLGPLDKSTLSSRRSSGGTIESVFPDVMAAVLHQYMWLLREDRSGSYDSLMNQFSNLPPSLSKQAEENLLNAKLALHTVHLRFRADIFFSTIAESTIALPLGSTGNETVLLSPSSLDMLKSLDAAEKLFWTDLALLSRRGNTARVRESILSLVTIRAFQTSLGRADTLGPHLVASLLDHSAAITLRREMCEAIQQKRLDLQSYDELQWTEISSEGCPAPRKIDSRGRRLFDPDLDSDDDEETDDRWLKAYWESLRLKYQSSTLDSSSLSQSHTSSLPSTWTVAHISVTEDKSTLFISRQRGGLANEPLVFCVPLKGRGEDDDQHLTFDDAFNEFHDIVRLNNESTKAAINVKDPASRALWWKSRRALDTRMRELMENVEFCWLGAFKTVLSRPPNHSPEVIANLRLEFDKVFQQGLHLQDKKTKQRALGHKRVASESSTPNRVSLDDALVECFSTLSPRCQDEELEDFVYFILDLYQSHGVPVVAAELDITQVVLDLRSVLEAHAVRTARSRKSPPPDEHLFLVLDKNLQGLPWESMPILRGRSVSRVPNVDFLLDRVEMVRWQKEKSCKGSNGLIDRAVVNPRKGYFILNPSGDLGRTEGRFKDWAMGMEEVGWKGVVGQAPSEQQMEDALVKNDLVMYFGHGGGEQYIRSHRIRHLRRCAALMLWGCSSGTMHDMGDFDRIGTPLHYMVAGCPTLVANLWDVTDGDIDKFSQSVLDKLRLTPENARNWTPEVQGQTSLVAAVAESRDSCKLKYLTGAAPIVYGIPFYL
ncbi:cysteine peptidase C50 [Mycena floridula]|nr:cysteine peptidase C50 [Mycena floridula]